MSFLSISSIRNSSVQDLKKILFPLFFFVLVWPNYNSKTIINQKESKIRHKFVFHYAQNMTNEVWLAHSEVQILNISYFLLENVNFSVIQIKTSNTNKKQILQQHICYFFYSICVTATVKQTNKISILENFLAFLSSNSTVL